MFQASVHTAIAKLGHAMANTRRLSVKQRLAIVSNVSYSVLGFISDLDIVFSCCTSTLVRVLVHLTETSVPK